MSTANISMSTANISLGWGSEVWNKINESVNNEAQRTKIADKILPVNGPIPGAVNVPSDVTQLAGRALSVNEGDTTSLIELNCQFVLTKTQVEQEQQMLTALTLATRAANLMSTAHDSIIFNDSKNLPAPVQARLNGNSGKGLLDRAPQSISVKATGKTGKKNTYGENTFAAVADSIALLQSDGHYGPYALILDRDTYADTHAPLNNTLIMPADRIRPLVEKGLHATGTLPPKRGLLLSLGGNTMDLTIGVSTTAEFMFVDDSGMYRFRVYERFTLRLKVPAVIRLELD